MAGTLYVVSTPIGNLEDISLRALRVLREAAVVAAEDTRRTAKLLAHYEITTPLESLHAHNEHARIPALLARLAAGASVALASDAGTPLVSDPGESFVRAALAAGCRVEAIPGPSAVLAALVVSGLPAAEGFTFLGFAPAREGERRRWLQAAGAEPRPVVFFEAPHRVRETLEAAGALLGDRNVAVSRELTKIHETHLRGSISAVLAALGEPRGEYTVVLAPAVPERPVPLTDAGAWAEFADLTGPGHLSRRGAVSAIARRHGVPAREVYAAIERAKPDAADK